jgi:hypothetical protein
METAKGVGILLGRECTEWHWQLHCVREYGEVAVYLNYYPTKGTLWIDSKDERWRSETRFECDEEKVLRIAQVIQSTLNGDAATDARVDVEAPRELHMDPAKIGWDETKISYLRPPVPEGVLSHAVEMVGASLRRRLNEKGPGAWQSSHEVLGIIAEEFHELQHAVEDNDLAAILAECLDLAVAATFAWACGSNKQFQW